jgi:hypothetical protein
MNKSTRKALKESIKHWERMSKFKSTEQFCEESTTSDNCALCLMFRKKDWGESEKNCIGCPVYEKIGKIDCEGTPFEPAHNALCSWSAHPSDQTLRAQWKKQAKKEIKFLKSLL